MTANTETASELVETLKTADQETAQAILEGEQEREEPRVTVVRAAEERLETLAVPGEVGPAPSAGAWGQLLDPDGNPVRVDGQPVVTELTP